MSDLWYPGAIRIPYTGRYSHYKQHLDGHNDLRIVDMHGQGVFTTNPDPAGLARWFNSPNGSGPYHFGIAMHGKYTGKVVQQLPTNVGAYALGGYSNKTPTGNSLNRTGKRHIAIVVVGVERSPNWDKLSPRAKLEWFKLLRWIKRTQGVPMHTPKGVKWRKDETVSTGKYFNRSGFYPHGAVPFQVGRSDGSGNGIPLGVVRKGNDDVNLTRRIRKLKKRLGE